MQAGISTLGITFGYGVESTAGTKPTSFKQLHRINKLGGISISNEKIDASALEDFVKRYVQGIGDTGGEFGNCQFYTGNIEGVGRCTCHP